MELTRNTPDKCVHGIEESHVHVLLLLLAITKKADKSVTGVKTEAQYSHDHHQIIS